MSSVGAGRQACLSWIPCQNGQVPSNAIQADSGLYVARVRIGADVTPGKVKSGYNTGYFPYNGKEECISAYEVLCDTGLHQYGPEVVWVPCANGHVPNNAVVAGTTAANQPLYVCRAKINGDACVGKVAPSHGTAFIPYGGKEHHCSSYDVLCYAT